MKNSKEKKGLDLQWKILIGIVGGIVLGMLIMAASLLMLS